MRLDILFATRWYPNPPDNGARQRAWGLLQGLAERHAVSLLSFVESGQESAPAPGLQQLCGSVRTVRFPPGRQRGARSFAALLNRRPRSLVEQFSPAMRDAIIAAVGGGRHDVVIAGTLNIADYAPYLGTLPAIFEDLEVGTHCDAVRGPLPRQLRAQATLAKLRSYLSALLPRFAACTVTSEVERRLVARLVPDYGRVHVVENGVDTTRPGGATAPRAGSMVFAGTLLYSPNLDAVAWFCERILPRIRARLPEAELLIAGHPPALPFSAPVGARCLGRVEDVRSLVASAAVSVAPVRFGGGTRIKILEAMALGTPVVSTSKGAEGLDVVHGEHLLIADDEDLFASQVVRLMRDRALAERLAAAALALVRRRYDRVAIGGRFCDLVEEVAERGRIMRVGRA